MTNDVSPYLPLAGFGGFNFLTAGTQPSQRGVAPAQRNILRLWDQAGDPKWLGRWEITIYDFSQQGLNHPEGEFSETSNGLAWSDFVTLRRGELIPPPTALSLTNANITGPVGFHTVYAFSTLMMGVGSAANNSLFKETSTTNPTPTAITYSPTGAICSLTRVLVSAGERVMVGRVGNAAQLLSDANGTVATTMHANTASLWGAILSPLNADPLKPGVPQLNMYYGTNLGYLSSDATMTNAPTNTHTVPAGGFTIGAIKAAGRAQMCYWGIPKVSNTSGALATGAYCDIYATPMDGSDDIIPVPMKNMPFGIKVAIPFGTGILMWDDTHVNYWDGDDEYDFALFKQRLSPLGHTNVGALNHDFVRQIKACFSNGVEVGVIYQSYDNRGLGATQSTYTHCEMYNFAASSWHNAGDRVELAEAGSNDASLCTNPAMSPTGQRVWFMDGGSSEKIQGFFIPRAYESLLWQHSLGGGGETNTAMPLFPSTASLLSPAWRLDATPPGAIPGTKSIAMAPKAIIEVEFNGNFDYGNGDASFNIQVQGDDLAGNLVTAFNQTFNAGRGPLEYIRKNPASAWANIRQVQLYLTHTRGTTANKTEKLLPFTVRGVYSKDGRAITSSDKELIKLVQEATVQQ